MKLTQTFWGFLFFSFIHQSMGGERT